MYSEIFAPRLKSAREESNYTQNDIAKELKISQSTYSKYETGKREPDLEKLATIATILNVKIDWLLGIGKKNDDETHQQKINEIKNRNDILKETEKEAKKTQKII